MRDIFNELGFKIENLTSIPYETLSSWKVGEAVIVDAVKRWTPLGFLGGINDEDKKRALAIAYDNVAYDILTERKEVVELSRILRDKGLDFESSVFPLIGRVIRQVNVKNFNYEKFLIIFKRFSFLSYDKNEAFSELDVEAEFFAILAFLILNVLNETIV